jgi:hypothetical protein
MDFKASCSHAHFVEEYYVKHVLEELGYENDYSGTLWGEEYDKKLSFKM